VSDLVRKIQSAILTGAGPNTLRRHLAALNIPAGAAQQPGALEEVRRCVLYPCSEDEMRSAFTSLGLTGEGDGDKARALQAVRRSILLS
jgi:hypothetical protein